ncbi:hypothetical protein IWZ00DRAFT_62916 [Phyllosticta capitalensis]
MAAGSVSSRSAFHLKAHQADSHSGSARRPEAAELSRIGCEADTLVHFTSNTGSGGHSSACMSRAAIADVWGGLEEVSSRPVGGASPVSSQKPTKASQQHDELRIRSDPDGDRREGRRVGMSSASPELPQAVDGGGQRRGTSWKKDTSHQCPPSAFEKSRTSLNLTLTTCGVARHLPTFTVSLLAVEWALVSTSPLTISRRTFAVEGKSGGLFVFAS